MFDGIFFVLSVAYCIFPVLDTSLTIEQLRKKATTHHARLARRIFREWQRANQQNLGYNFDDNSFAENFVTYF